MEVELNRSKGRRVARAGDSGARGPRLDLECSLGCRKVGGGCCVSIGLLSSALCFQLEHSRAYEPVI